MIAFPSSCEALEICDPGWDIMSRLQAGDESAFEDLVNQYSGLVDHIIRKLMGSWEPVDDIRQDVFLRVLKAVPHYQSTAKFSTWISVIARNTALNARRDSGRRREYVVESSSLDETPALAHARPAPLQVLVLEEEREMLYRAIRRLNQRQQRAIKLVYFSRLSYAEAADELEMTSMAVKSLLARAKVRIRELLAGSMSPCHPI